MFACLQTGVGTNTTSTTYFGPFDNFDDADSFVELVRGNYSELEKASTMAVSIVDEPPEGRGCLEPGSFKGFMKLS